MDGALYLWALFKDVFKDIENKVLILDIIHVLEYIWIIAHIKHKEGSAKGKKYVYKKLLLILQGKVASY
ncbi:MAG: ISKra4 family transposase, partial [Desulfobacterales bacterium]